MTREQIEAEIAVEEKRVSNLRSQEEARRAARIRRDILLLKLELGDYEGGR